MGIFVLPVSLDAHGKWGLNGAPAKGTPELVPAGHRKAWQPCRRAPHALVALVFTLRNS